MDGVVDEPLGKSESACVSSTWMTPTSCTPESVDFTGDRHVPDWASRKLDCQANTNLTTIMIGEKMADSLRRAVH